MQRRNAGFVILTVLAFLTGVITLSGVGITRSMTERTVAQQYAAQQQAFYLAEAGVDEALFWLRTQAAPPGCPTTPIPPEGCPLTVANVTGTRTASTGTYNVAITLPPENTNSSIKSYILSVTSNITATNPPIQRTLTYRVKTESFARFAYFSDSEFPPKSKKRITFTTGDLITGPMHTNGQFGIDGNPVFDGPASSVSSSLYYDNGGPPNDNPAFNGGLTLGAAAIPLPTVTSTQLQSNANLVLQGDTSIALSGNTMLVTNSANSWVNQPVPISTNGVVFVNGGNLTIAGGEVRGQLTLSSSQDVLITNSVTYACNPETLLPGYSGQPDPDCLDPSTGQATRNTDVLGIVAGQNITLTNAAPYDVSLQASLMALNTSFGFEGADTLQRGTLHIYGGLIQKNRNTVSSGIGPSTGYRKDYRYDTRFTDLAPPYFPTTGKYQTVMWQDQ